MKKESFKYYDRLGFMNPNYIINNNEIRVNEKFHEIVRQKDTINKIDIVSIIEILNRGYAFSDRTIIKDIQKTPWMAKPSEVTESWDYVKDLPEHGQNSIDDKEIADSLFSRLVVEIREYIGDKSTIGILLSGGMDSRVVSAVIKYLQDSKEIDVTVVALTWGKENSRDVIYAEKIVKLFNWEWKHFKLNSENLIENIEVAAENGAAYSPVHLHAMPKIRELKSIDCIIAGSFGDSIGRAEYSGIKVQNLTSLSNVVMNRFKILKNSVYKEYNNQVKYDLEIYHTLFPRHELYQEYELERQLHYMRKQLNQCMSIIDQKIPLYQAFTAPKVFGYMWSLSPECRTDKVYYNILEKYSPKLLNIPWARNGCKYLTENCDYSDGYSKNYHSYGKWIREDLYPLLKTKVLSKAVEDLNIFNMDALEKLFWINSFSNQESLTKTDEHLIWLASLSDCVKMYDIKGIEDKNFSFQDSIDGKFTSALHYIAYNLKLKL
ncbi:MAG TPA: hypothetical protein EYG89_01800 [Bacteroidia bacterium]|nr:hypothetical protein [Bacteroidia bacterium]